MASRKTTLRPYSFAENCIDLELESFKIDGSIRKGTLVDEGSKSIDLTSKGFETATLKFSYNINEDLSEYSPEDEPPFEILVKVQNITTHTRRVILRENIKDSGTFEVILQRKDFRGQIEIEPEIVRQDSTHQQQGYATDTRKIIGDGAEWTIDIDENSASGSGIACVCEDFSELEDERITADMMFYLDISNMDEPKILLNQKSEKMRNIMDNRASQGKNARIRDILNDVVFLPVMYQLLLRSLASTDPKTGESSHPLERSMFRGFTRKMDYDEEKIESLASTLENPSEVEELSSEIARYLQIERDIPEDIQKMINRVQN